MPLIPKRVGLYSMPLTNSSHAELGSILIFRRYYKFPDEATMPSLTFPQLVIVGDQSTGKSSLLRTLTDIPFPVAEGCCTRFATRIVSRRTAPGTPNQVKISIVPPDFMIKHFNYPSDDHYRTYHEIRDSITAEEFSRITEKVWIWMVPLATLKILTRRKNLGGEGIYGLKPRYRCQE